MRNLVQKPSNEDDASVVGDCTHVYDTPLLMFAIVLEEYSQCVLTKGTNHTLRRCESTRVAATMVSRI